MAELGGEGGDVGLEVVIVPSGGADAGESTQCVRELDSEIWVRGSILV